MEQNILDAYSEGLNNRQIARKLGCNHRTVAYWLDKHKLKSNLRKGVRIEIVSDTEAKCNKCFEIKPLNEFLYGRKGQKYEYRFSYCRLCRKKQLYLNLNNSTYRFLSDKYNRLVNRAREEGCACNITKKDFIEQFDFQQGKCFYTDEIMVCKVGMGKSRNSCSVDKIIPKLGYIKGNIVFCTNRTNTAKSDFSLAEIKLWMPLWYKKIVAFWRSQGLTCLQVAEGDF